MRNKLLTAFLLGMIFFLLLGYTNNWVESTPTDATVANQIDDFNRKVRVDVAERLETYIGGFNSSDSNAGFYGVLFIEKASTPSTPAAAKGMLYGKAVGGKCELFYIDEDGDEIQLTTGGDTGGGHVQLLAGMDLLGSATSDITMNTDKFTVAGATGNTVIGGTLAANGTITLAAGKDLIGSATSDITFNTDKFTVAGDTGNTVVAGTLDVTGVATFTAAPVGIFTPDNSTVLFATATLTTANTFQDIDASGTVGSNAALLLIKVVSAGDIRIAVRTNGESGTGAAWGSDDTYSRGANQCILPASGDIGTLFVMTDSSGVFEIAGNVNNVNITVTLIGYIK